MPIIGGVDKHKYEAALEAAKKDHEALLAERRLRESAEAGMLQAEQRESEALRAAKEAEAKLEHTVAIHSTETLLAVVHLDPEALQLALRQVDTGIRIDWVGWNLYIYAPGPLSPPALNAIEAWLHATVSINRT